MTNDPDVNEIKELQLRIEKLESMLERVGTSRQQPSSLTAEEMAAYRKVRDVIAADFGEFCGINDCFRCVVVRCSLCQVFCDVRCRPCDVECVCGPCGLGGGGFAGGLRRFGNLGGSD